MMYLPEFIRGEAVTMNPANALKIAATALVIKPIIPRNESSIHSGQQGIKASQYPIMLNNFWLTQWNLIIYTVIH
jgi:hypothetical protein